MKHYSEYDIPDIEERRERIRQAIDAIAVVDELNHLSKGILSVKGATFQYSNPAVA